MAISKDLILQALSKEDIESLLAYGAPEDEYDPEAIAIADNLLPMPAEELNLEVLTSLIATVWREYFGPYYDENIELRMPAFQKVATEILKNK